MVPHVEQGDVKISHVEQMIVALPCKIGAASLIIMEAYQLLLAKLLGQGACFQVSCSSREEVRETDGITHVLDSLDVSAGMGLTLISTMAKIKVEIMTRSHVASKAGEALTRATRRD